MGSEMCIRDRGLAEVYEVASFYHHFQILRDDQIAPVLTVRVCTGQSCAMSGSEALQAGIQAATNPSLRVLAAPCLGRCEQAPAVLIGQRALAHAGLPGVLDAVSSALEPRPEIDVEARTHSDLIDYQAYRKQGGYALAAAVVNGEQSAEDVIAVSYTHLTLPTIYSV